VLSGLLLVYYSYFLLLTLLYPHTGTGIVTEPHARAL
jgi:hypothetical protein